MENKRLGAAFDVIIKEIRSGERELERTIEQRDEAEECASQMYCLIVGRSPEWSNIFGYKQAIDDVNDVQYALRQELAALRSRQGEGTFEEGLEAAAQLCEELSDCSPSFIAERSLALRPTPEAPKESR